MFNTSYIYTALIKNESATSTWTTAVMKIPLTYAGLENCIPEFWNTVQEKELEMK